MISAVELFHLVRIRETIFYDYKEESCAYFNINVSIAVDCVSSEAPMKKSQARSANVISVGDIIVSIDGEDVLSKNYSTIISILKDSSKQGGR